jgi:hypothetical protein
MLSFALRLSPEIERCLLIARAGSDALITDFSIVSRTFNFLLDIKGLSVMVSLVDPIVAGLEIFLLV